MANRSKPNTPYSFEITVPAGSFHLFDFDRESTEGKSAPFDNYVIFNQQGGGTLKIYENGKTTGYQILPASVILERQEVGINRLKINNDSSTSSTFNITFNNDNTDLKLLKALVLGKEEIERIAR